MMTAPFNLETWYALSLRRYFTDDKVAKEIGMFTSLQEGRQLADLFKIEKMAEASEETLSEVGYVQPAL